ncbi:MAG: DUF2173 family protein [Gammaproteobacteria bacterium]|nr:DUF2173 family protein [Gammaproteobacteria bacterium]NIR97616.1 DUF2173 family protein [Gammaproteobacteria bacterium]NIT63266.1 DUF2173 family protein [Gammaproteobacteria bacterium]NIV20198.1 DUF2173 family protein [Gammaproteobacteria bacterium]NIY31846.1 DUF2173 family protein [Gammaproteobacteria bacterium]
MIKRLMAVEGVTAVCRFRDDGAFVAGYGSLDETKMAGLARFARDYKRMLQGNADQLSMFGGVRGWTPPVGWIVRGQTVSVCGAGNLVCLLDQREGSLSEVLRELQEVAHW